MVRMWGEAGAKDGKEGQDQAGVRAQANGFHLNVGIQSLSIKTKCNASRSGDVWGTEEGTIGQTDLQSFIGVVRVLDSLKKTNADKYWQEDFGWQACMHETT